MRPPASSVRVLLSLLLALASPLQPALGAEEGAPPGKRSYFYLGLDYGSESSFNPATSFVNYSLDTLQIRESFDDHDLRHRFQVLMHDLGHPDRAINEEGGFGKFIHRQVFPTDLDHLDDSVEMIPNYALHLIGGGMVYRRNAEWLEARGYGHPRTYAAILCTAAELFQETIEKRSTPADDPVADVYIFLPAGMLLFNSDRVARFAADRLHLVGWPYQPMANVTRGEWTNAGENFVVRPRLFRSEIHTPFVYFGPTTLLGASHRVSARDRFSWGAGAAIVKATRESVKVRTSGGLFYDRNDSLLASLIVNGTEGLAVRANLYPGVILRGRWSPGVFLGVRNGGGLVAGFTVRPSPFGIAAASR